MKIILVDTNDEVVDAWREACRGIGCVSIRRGSILQVPCDAIVSPANSFGFMDGGLDFKISAFLGWHVQERLQELIRTRHHGELVVGTAEVVPTDNDKIPYVISAPTMRVPMVLSDTVNVYLATRAVLLLLRHGTFADGKPVSEAVSTIAMPGMGTGVGRVEPAVCARQMAAAIREVALGEHTFPDSWQDAQTRHQLLFRDRVHDLQFE